MTTVVELGNALFADLAHALTGETHLGTDLLKTTLLATDTEALTYNLQLTILQHTAEHVLTVGGEGFIIYMLIGTRVVA